MTRHTLGSFFLVFFLFVAPCVAAQDPRPAMSVSLDPAEPGQVYLGSLVTFTATVSDAAPGTLWYRFRERRDGGDFRVIRDYSPLNSLDWSPGVEDGLYEIEVSAVNRLTGDTAATPAILEALSAATYYDSPAITATSHPLVFIYSAPPCDEGSRMRVRFSSGSRVTYTPFKECAPDRTMNFYLAGLKPKAEYEVKHIVTSGVYSIEGPGLTLTVPDAGINLPAYTVETPPAAGSTEDVLMLSAISHWPAAIATNLTGELLWYYPGQINWLTRAHPGGTFFGIFADTSPDLSNQALREFDLAGVTLRETNVARVNEQLEVMGRRPVTAFHHEAGRLPGGRIVVLAYHDEILEDVQGPGPVDVVGDTILVFDDDMQLVWAWDTFDFLDPRRKATLDEGCGPPSTGCSPQFKAPAFNDWTHGNSVTSTPDGNLLYSIRHQDWVVKIDYAGGLGNGSIMWRLGQDGDFRLEGSAAGPWFSHQHDASILAGDKPRVLLFDNGNVRHDTDPTALSRGQLYELDETGGTAKLVLNSTVGQYSAALGSAHQLPNGNFHFNLGFLVPNRSRSVEVAPAGNVVYSVVVGVMAYRSFRMSDLYAP